MHRRRDLQERRTWWGLSHVKGVKAAVGMFVMLARWIGGGYAAVEGARSHASQLYRCTSEDANLSFPLCFICHNYNRNSQPSQYSEIIIHEM